MQKNKFFSSARKGVHWSLKNEQRKWVSTSSCFGFVELGFLKELRKTICFNKRSGQFVQFYHCGKGFVDFRCLFCKLFLNHRKRIAGGLSLDKHRGKKITHLLVRKEITLDLLANHSNDQGLLHEVVGFHHLLNLRFL